METFLRTSKRTFFQRVTICVYQYIVASNYLAECVCVSSSSRQNSINKLNNFIIVAWWVTVNLNNICDIRCLWSPLADGHRWIGLMERWPIKVYIRDLMYFFFILRCFIGSFYLRNYLIIIFNKFQQSGHFEASFDWINLLLMKTTLLGHLMINGWTCLLIIYVS